MFALFAITLCWSVPWVVLYFGHEYTLLLVLGFLLSWGLGMGQTCLLSAFYCEPIKDRVSYNKGWFIYKPHQKFFMILLLSTPTIMSFALMVVFRGDDGSQAAAGVIMSSILFYVAIFLGVIRDIPAGANPGCFWGE